MRAVVQRTTQAKVIVENEIVGEINHGFMVLLGVEPEDTQADIDFIADKIVNLRVFEDENEKMNLSLKEVEGKILLISQFTLMGDCRKGRRPNFMNAAGPDLANDLYEKTKEKIESLGIPVEKGVFGAYMQVDFINDGPVTLLIDSKKNF